MTHPDTRQSPEQIASLCLALSNPARVQIVRLLLREGEMLVKELMEELHQSQTFVSRHLELLRRQEVVHFRKEGRLHGKNANYVYYSVRPDKMEWLKKVVL